MTGDVVGGVFASVGLQLYVHVYTGEPPQPSFITVLQNSMAVDVLDPPS